jgi:hypothetical protein
MFLKELKELIDSGDLRVELKVGSRSHMVLKGTYGEKIHKTFGMTRQGVRWRFQHIFGCEYVEAFEAVLFIEKIFGSQLREYAMRISREKYSLRQEMLNLGLPKAKKLPKK